MKIITDLSHPRYRKLAVGLFSFLSKSRFSSWFSNYNIFIKFKTYRNTEKCFQLLCKFIMNDIKTLRRDCEWNSNNIFGPKLKIKINVTIFFLSFTIIFLYVHSLFLFCTFGETSNYSNNSINYSCFKLFYFYKDHKSAFHILLGNCAPFSDNC